MGGFSAPKLETVRIAVIGVGARGPAHLKFSASLPGTEIVAISDLYEDLAKKMGRSSQGNWRRTKTPKHRYILWWRGQMEVDAGRG